MKLKNTIIIIGVLVYFLFSGAHLVLAATVTGSSAYVWGENIGWLNFKANGGNIAISDAALTGYVWSPNYGWINLSPTTGGVTNSCSGVLGGYAWSGTLGWIDFTGASIDSNGKFIGTIGTSGSTVGRIKFDCSNCSVITDWRPSCATTPTPTPTSAPGATSTSGPGATSTPSPNTTMTPQTNPTGTSPNQIIQNQISNLYTSLTSSEQSALLQLLSQGGSVDTSQLSLEQLRIFNLFNKLPKSEQETILAKLKNGDLSKQLFDIKLELVKSTLTKAGDLSIRIRFESFGNVATPVDLTYAILDSKGKEVWRQKDSVTVETEKVVLKDFKNLSLPDGKYTFVLTTLYNTSVKDEFKQSFTIGSNFQVQTLVQKYLWLIVLIVIFFIVLVARRKKNKEKI